MDEYPSHIFLQKKHNKEGSFEDGDTTEQSKLDVMYSHVKGIPEFDANSTTELLFLIVFLRQSYFCRGTE